MSQTDDEEVNIRTAENQAAYDAMDAQVLQAIEDGEPPARLFQTNFRKSLRIVAALCQALNTPTNTQACDAAYNSVRKIIQEETVENSIGRLFWGGRFQKVYEWMDSESDQILFSSDLYTSSNNSIDDSLSFRSPYPFVNAYLHNFRLSGDPRTVLYNKNGKIAENEEVSGLADPKGTLALARQAAHDASLWELQILVAQAEAPDGVIIDPGPPSSHNSRHGSLPASSHEEALSNYQRSLLDIGDAPFGQDHNEETDYESDFEDLAVSEVEVPLSRRIAPLPLAQRLSALAISDTPRSRSKTGTPLRRKAGTGPSKAQARAIDASSFLADVVHLPGPKRSRTADDDSDTEEDSDRDDEKSVGDEFDTDAVDSHQQALDDMYARHLEPSEASRTGSAFRTFNRAQYIRAYNPKRFKAIIGSLQFAMHIRAMEACARNERWDFESLNAYDSMPEAELSAIAALPGVFTSGKLPTRPFTTGLQFARCFAVFIRFRTFWYPWEKKGLDKFILWFISRLDESPDKFQNYIAFFLDVFPKIGVPGFPVSLRHAITDTPRLLWERTQEQDHQERERRKEERRKRRRSATNGMMALRPILVVGFTFVTNADRTNTESTTAQTWEERERISEERGRKDQTELPRLPQDSEDLATDSFPLAGTFSIPKLSRNLHFPSSQRPLTPSVDSTLTDPPLPSVPDRVLNDPIIAATLQARPDLFKVSTPINIPRFARLLANHPNRPLVDSVLHGLEHGFWPGHDGDFSNISHLSGSAPHLDDEELDFLSDSAASDYEKGYFSEPFDKLYPGMHISPSYVTNTENQRRRQICDQTGSGLNDGVTKEISRVRYDAQQELGALARWRHRRGDLQAPKSKAVWWKSDVSGGFRNLGTSIYWQIKQVHRIRIRLPNGRYIWIYYVDGRLMLGGRMSPRIFCTVMSLTLWAVRYELFLEFPLAFVDDAFGIDCTGVRSSITHLPSGETRLVPCEQAKVLEMWNFIGMPWDWKKQVSSVSLVIIGNLFTIHPNFDLTISLADESVEKFASSIESFLTHPSGRRPLKDWLHIQGYANWAVGVFPWGKFALQCLYEKTAGKSMMRLGVSVSDIVKKDLRWFIQELRTSAPLSLLDPSLDHWGVEDADIILYTDACLTSDDGSSSGLGFWTRSWIHGRRLCFYSRIIPALMDIRWAEAVAVFSAINWALDNTRARRILIFTDSALCVYAFDSGKIQLGPMHDLVWSLYARLAEKKVDLRVAARALSPQIHGRPHDFLPALRSLGWAAEIDCFNAGYETPALKVRRKRTSPVPPKTPRTNFAPFSSSTPRKKLPHLPINRLQALMDDLMLHSLASGTRRGYKSSLKHWSAFIKIYKFDRIPTEESLPLFATFLSTRVKHPNKVLSAMASHFKPQIKDWDAMRKTYALQQVLTGAAKQPHAPTKRSPALLPTHLVAFVEKALLPNASYDCLLFAFITALGFCGIMRLGDGLIEYDKVEDREWRKVIKRSSVVLIPGVKVEFFLPYNKGDRFYRGNTVILKPENSPSDFNVVDLFQLYLRRRDALFPNNDRLLIRENGKPPFRNWVVPLIRSVAPEVSGHGLRAGGATWLAMRGVPADIIKRLGRWTSDQWEIYIRDHPDLSAAIAKWILRLHL
ncbi:hypothetical protein P7C70_g7472, partial [Phenoliferia sp. Uapishka_3]